MSLIALEDGEGVAKLSGSRGIRPHLLDTTKNRSPILDGEMLPVVFVIDGTRRILGKFGGVGALEDACMRTRAKEGNPKGRNGR